MNSFRSVPEKRDSVFLLIRLLLLLGVPVVCPSTCSAEDALKVDVCDVSFLWPVPNTADEAAKLISLDERLTEDGEAICPQSVFDSLIQHAVDLELTDPVSGERVRIEFPDDRSPDDRLKVISNWKIAGIRIDPSAPGCSSKIRVDQGYGSIAQVRVIAQPVTVDDEQAQAHDFTLHLVFQYVRNEDRPFAVDQDRFKRVVESLLAIKEKLKEVGIETSGAPLGVHPGFRSSDVDLTGLLKTFLENNLRSNRLNAAAFMGIKDESEPWVFFTTSKNSETGKFELVSNHPSIAPSAGQVLSFVTTSKVFPIPRNHQFGSIGVSTLQLFSPKNPNRKAFPKSDDPELVEIQVKHIADIVANPEMSHFFTTDCISCHSESSLRHLKLEGKSTKFAFKLPAGISGVDPNMLPITRPDLKAWNVRNFGWGFKEIGQNMVPTVTMRTANEAAESAEFINTTYFLESAFDTTDDSNHKSSEDSPGE